MMAAADPDLDPITFAVVKSALESVVDDMAYTIMRTARSEIVRDVLDYSATLCNAAGRADRPGADRGAASGRRARRDRAGAGRSIGATSRRAT